MSRLADEDLKNLERFLVEYRVARDLGAQTRAALLKRSHRQVLAALQVWRLLQQSAESGTATISCVKLDPSSDVLGFIGEYFSDLVCVLACLIHGLYKPANTQLRSAIENLVRGLAGLTSLEAKETKLMYRLFELAGAQAVFVNGSAADLALLQQLYGEQCLYVHSATPAQRTGAHHVAAHMRQDTTQLKSVVAALTKVNQSALSVLVRAHKGLYIGGSSRVRDLLDEILPKDVRLFTLGASAN